MPHSVNLGGGGELPWCCETKFLQEMAENKWKRGRRVWPIYFLREKAFNIPATRKTTLFSNTIQSNSSRNHELWTNAESLYPRLSPHTHTYVTIFPLRQISLWRSFLSCTPLDNILMISASLTYKNISEARVYIISEQKISTYILNSLA